jgi:DHA1 family solute carrier family 18 vesicular amine transporter 1/2
MGVAADYISRTRIGAYFHEARGSRQLVLLIVAVALLLDNMLLTTVVPIIPEFLYQIRHQNDNQTTPSLEDWTPPGTISTTAVPRTQRDDDSKNTETLQGMSGPTITDGYEFSDDDGYDDEYGGKTTPSKEKDMADAFQRHREYLRRKHKKHRELSKENVEVGIMFASKAVVQLIANPFVGPLTNRIGYDIPMFCGFVIMFFSTLIFAFSRSYFVLFLARALQGIGSSCSSVAGMGMLADRYPNDKERGNAMGLALGGLALGVLIGPPFGGFMYQFVGKSSPFIILAVLALLDGCLQLMVLQPSVHKSDEDAPSLKALITDPYILVCSGAITFSNMGMGMLEPSLPIFMMDKMDAPKWQLGAAFLPASISYLIGTNLFGPLGHRIGRWLASLIGMILIGLSLILVAFATQPNHLIVPMAGLGFGIGMVDSSMMPELGNLVDIRHTSAVYGGVYAIGDVAFCLGFAIGPALSGSLVEGVGFPAMAVGMGLICFAYSPLLYLLKSPPHRTEQEMQEATQLVLGEGGRTKVKYANFDEEMIGMTQTTNNSDGSGGYQQNSGGGGGGKARR